jgi:hypothetical protein
MTTGSIARLPLQGSCIRVVYSLEGMEMFAIGVLVSSSADSILMEQYSDQFGPVDPFRLTIQWSNVIRLTVDGPASASSRSARTR